MTNEEIKAWIKRRRLQMLISSYLYEKQNFNVFSDYEWDLKAKELAKVQDEHQDLASQVEYADMFKGWTGDSGAFLIFDDNTVRRANRVRYLMEKEGKKK